MIESQNFREDAAHLNGVVINCERTDNVLLCSHRKFPTHDYFFLSFLLLRLNEKPFISRIPGLIIVPHSV